MKLFCFYLSRGGKFRKMKLSTRPIFRLDRALIHEESFDLLGEGHAMSGTPHRIAPAGYKSINDRCRSYDIAPGALLGRRPKIISRRYVSTFNHLQSIALGAAA
jgi:hypothetical protein